MLGGCEYEVCLAFDNGVPLLQHPFAGMITTLQNQGALPPHWRCVAAPRTYNPLGSYLT